MQHKRVVSKWGRKKRNMRSLLEAKKTKKACLSMVVDSPTNQCAHEAFYAAGASFESNEDIIMEKLENKQGSSEDISETIDTSFDVAGPSSSNFVDSSIVEHQEIDDVSMESVGVTNGNDKEKGDLEELNVLTGRRIVDIAYFINELISAASHSSLYACTLKNMIPIKEELCGFIAIITFQCNMCKFTQKIRTTEENTNRDIVAGVINVGSGHSHLAQISASLNLPCMSNNAFQKETQAICKAWEDEAVISMKMAAEEEKNIAQEEGTVNSEGIPEILVTCDGAWSKRSYRNKYNAASGVATIVGYKTGKILFMGVRNKFCIICKKAEENKEVAKEHRCFKNWDGPSTGMESDIILEGFKSSMKTHGLIYKYMISDGDSNVYKKIKDNCPYGSNIVEKIECRNHLFRNFCTKISENCKKANMGPVIIRKKIKASILRLRSGIQKAIRYRKSENLPRSNKIENLKHDILNSIKHVAGYHENCAEYFCNKNDDNNDDNNYFDDLKNTPIFEKISDALSHLAKNSRSLLYDVDNNKVEHFNSIVAKYVGGKRINFSKAGSYRMRCYGALLSYNNKNVISTTKKYFKVKVGKYARKYELSRLNKKKYKKNKSFTKKVSSAEDQNYGPNCEKPDVTNEEYEGLKEDYFRILENNLAHLKNIELVTRNQRESKEWKTIRKLLLTASYFGRICKVRSPKSYPNIVKHILYNKFDLFKNVPGLQFGVENEKNALDALAAVINKDIKSCGLYISSKYPFLGATPDGVVDDNIIVEVKCSYSAREMTPEEGIEKRKITFWDKNKKIVKNHSWYYLIQGQLQITNASTCYFGVWTPQGIFYSEIKRDDEFWSEKMEDKLIKFYKEHLLPEILDPRFVRSMPIRYS